jgi:hypothetical protein
LPLQKLWHNTARTYDGADFGVAFFAMFPCFLRFRKVNRRITL